MITDWAIRLIIVLTLFKPVSSFANDLYVTQVGDLFDGTIVQDGEDNSVRSLNTTSGNAYLGGNNKTFTMTQQGDNNRAGFWTHGGNQQMSLTQDGNNNVSAMDNHGNNNNMTVNIDGDSNVTHTEIGNGGDSANVITVTIDNGDSNTLYTEVLNGDSNTIDVQVHEQSNNINRVIVNGDNNDITAWQGKHEAGNVDSNETGDNDVYWIVSGNNNTLESYQTDDNNKGGLHIANYITGDSNIVHHTQRGSGEHEGFVEINGDNNDVTLLQRGNSDTQFADIVLDDGHTVDVFQRYGDHTANIDLTNAGGGYNLDLDQTANSNKTYNLTGTCTNANGCGISVTQN
tara:strand:- start:1955 stop:2986 length:1032 start_codon:yes stop_codon:yes gene_type:complete